MHENSAVARRVQKSFAMSLPPLVFVLGKGGVGRTTIAAGLGSYFAARGERTLIVQWTIADAVSPRFGKPPAGHEAQEIAPKLWTMNFSAAETLREYFVDHLGWGLFFRAVVARPKVRRLWRAVPGIEELLFLGRLFWLTTLFRGEKGWAYDRIVVDAPALGHGISLFGVPRATASLGLGGLLEKECERTGAMLSDPARTGALLVTTLEELAVEETLELLPRLTGELGRPPLALVINRSVARLGALPLDPRACEWFTPAFTGLELVYASLARKSQRERALRDRFPDCVTVEDGLLRDEISVAEAARELECRG